MSRLEALRRLLAAPRDHHHQGRIGRTAIYATSDGRERLTLVYRVMRFVTRKVA